MISQYALQKLQDTCVQAGYTDAAAATASAAVLIAIAFFLGWVVGGDV